MAKTKYQDEHLRKFYKRKTFDLKKETADEFDKKCKELKISQRSVIIEAIENFIKNN